MSHFNVFGHAFGMTNLQMQWWKILLRKIICFDDKFACLVIWQIWQITCYSIVFRLWIEHFFNMWKCFDNQVACLVNELLLNFFTLWMKTKIHTWIHYIGREIQDLIRGKPLPWNCHPIQPCGEIWKALMLWWQKIQ